MIKSLTHTTSIETSQWNSSLWITSAHCSRPWVGCVRLRLNQHYSPVSHNKLLKHNNRSTVGLVYAQLTSWRSVDMWGMGPSSLFFNRQLHSIRVIREMMKIPRSGVRSHTMLQGSSSGSLQEQPQTISEQYGVIQIRREEKRREEKRREEKRREEKRREEKRREEKRREEKRREEKRDGLKR